MALSRESKQLFLLGNYLFEDAEVSVAESSTGDFLYPLSNALDPRTSRPARFSTSGSSSKDLVFRCASGLAGDFSAFHPDCILVAGLGNRTDTSSSFEQDGLDVTVYTATSATGPWTAIAIHVWDPTNGNAILLDFEENGVSTALRKRQWWRIQFEKIGAGNLAAVDVGAVMLANRYVSTHNVEAPYTVEVNNLNVVTGEDTASLAVHKSNAPAIRHVGRFWIESDEERHKLIQRLRGYDGVLQPSRFNHFERLNWPCAFVDPFSWVSGSGLAVGVPTLGYLVRSRVTTENTFDHVCDFVFDEIAGSLS